jgi:hypothetical protein
MSADGNSTHVRVDARALKLGSGKLLLLFDDRLHLMLRLE